MNFGDFFPEQGDKSEQLSINTENMCSIHISYARDPAPSESANLKVYGKIVSFWDKSGYREFTTDPVKTDMKQQQKLSKTSIISQ